MLDEYTFIQALIDLRNTYIEGGILPSSINCGYCADYATVIWEKFRESGLVRVVDNTDFRPKDDYIHTFLKFGNKYYDAECICGSEHWENLPIFSRLEVF